MDPGSRESAGAAGLQIGLVVYDGLENRSGGNLYDQKLVEELERRRHRVTILPLRRRPYWRSLLGRADPGLGRKERELDLLIEDELVHPSRWPRRRTTSAGNVPLVGIVHHLRCSENHPAPLRWIYRSVERRYLRTLDAFVFNSRTTRTTVERLVGRDLPHSVVATPGGDRLGPPLSRQEVERRCRRSRGLRLLFAGNVIRRKGLHRLLVALSALEVEDWSLDVVGGLQHEPRYARRMRRLSTRTALAGRVHFHGPVSDARLRDLMHRSDALVMPSSYEGFGIVYLEGMACGLPAVAGSTGGAAEVIESGSSGLLVPPSEPPHLARALQRLAADRELRLRLSLGALRRYGGFPTWQDSCSKIADFLERLAAPAGSAAGSGS